ncbi:class I SAM-dependent methyltransferase [Bosea sp. 685]|uniref:class I SAM-dependent methyltransferase n=1 Tax=Bosea sp. 685 TaxID=3080057 RepID=UPI002893039B|nr:class I SAM-dependent methyltransferase [Bosea sp. 685]WNJ90037.1 class I SAM-dependent methyltransferase [Bosea sp. 685]
MSLIICSICGNDEFEDTTILWPALIEEWEISTEEADYINRQQGTHCVRCKANLRGVALGNAIREVVGTGEPLTRFVKTSSAGRLRVLDINGTAASEVLSALPGYVRADYPDVDMQAMPFKAASFDVVIHSDTLEHVPRPLDGLKECRRILAPNGHLCYTVPIIVGRMTRNRQNLRPSYHGNPEESGYDFIVQTEFGADAWTFPLQAGFSSVKINTVSFPAATALTAC